MRSPQILLALATASTVTAWGSLGHKTIAYLAEKHFTKQTSAYVTSLLAGDDLGYAATWADSYRNIAKYTAGWHYIDAMDHPPSSCNVNFSRDCPPTEGGCVVSAIVNMTSRIQDSSLSAADHNQAIKFLIHFIGDIHQPLHTENEDRGGNGINVTFDKVATNLHSIWDTAILLKLTNSTTANKTSEDDVAMAWASKLFSSSKKLSANCTDITTPQACALVWAGEANSKVCSYVLKDDVAGVESVDLGGAYYIGAVPIVQEQISKAGIRLGAWLNALAAKAGSGSGSSGGSVDNGSCPITTRDGGDWEDEDSADVYRRSTRRCKRELLPELGCSREN